MCVLVVFFFFKQKTAYEMRISDWSSDVCSSDLEPRLEYLPNQVKSVELGELERAIRSLPEQQRVTVLLVGLQGMDYKEVAEITGVPLEIGRASCRERVCQCV